MLGLVDAVHAPRPGLAWSPGDTVGAVPAARRGGGSVPLEGMRWATERLDHPRGRIPSVDFAAHSAVCAFVADLVAAQVAGGDAPPLLHAVHDVSGGGLAVAPWPRWPPPRASGCTLDIGESARALH